MKTDKIGIQRKEMKLRKLVKQSMAAAVAAFLVHAAVFFVYTTHSSLFDRANPFVLVIAGFFLMGFISSFLFLKDGGVMDKRNWSAPLVGSMAFYFPLLAVALAFAVPSPMAVGYFMAALICFPFSLFGVAVAVMLYIGKQPIEPYRALLMEPFIICCSCRGTYIYWTAFFHVRELCLSEPCNNRVECNTPPAFHYNIPVRRQILRLLHQHGN